MLLTHSDFVSSNPVAKLAVSGGARQRYYCPATATG
jgi:hypothetical protein